jgi:hypothetical protein
MKMLRTNNRVGGSGLAFEQTRLPVASGRWKECAFWLYPRTHRRVLHISLVFREMWDSSALAPYLPNNADLFLRRPGSSSGGASPIVFGPRTLVRRAPVQSCGDRYRLEG